MLAKILFTAAVVIGVVLFFRDKRQTHDGVGHGDSDGDENPTRSLSPRALTYGLLALLLGASALFAFIDA